MNQRNIFTQKENEQLVKLLGLKNIKWTNDSALISCPKHKDKTPSLSIDLINGIFKCFSCGYSGTLNQLFYDNTGQSANKALGKSTKLSKFDTVFEKTSNFGRFFNQEKNNDSIEELDESINILLPSFDLTLLDREVQRYLRKRGIYLETAKAMNFGYIKNQSKVNSIKHNTRKIMTVQKRLVIPIFENGKLISAELRDTTGLSGKKVLYPAGSSTNTLYNHFELDKNSPIYITEGLLDLAVLKNSSFFSNATSTFGTSSTTRKLNIMKTFKHIVFIPDNDTPGRKAIEEKYEVLKSYNIKIEVLEVPASIKDPGDIPKKYISVQNLLDKGWIAKNTICIDDFLFKYSLGIY